MKRILIYIIFTLIIINGLTAQNQVNVYKATVTGWIIYKGDTLAVSSVSGDTLFITRGATLDTLITGPGASRWFLSGDTAKTIYNVKVDSSFLMDYRNWYMGYSAPDKHDNNYDSLVFMGYISSDGNKYAVISAGSPQNTTYNIDLRTKDGDSTAYIVQGSHSVEMQASDNTNVSTVKVTPDSTSITTPALYLHNLPTATKTGEILHKNQYDEVETMTLSGLGDDIDSARAASPTAYTTWVRDSTKAEVSLAREFDNVKLTWPDSIMYTANNTGADYTVAHTYEAFKFVADKDYPLGTLGPIDIYMKKDAGVSNLTGAVQKYIYSDNAGVPGTALTAITEPEVYGHLTTSYTPYPSQNGSPELTSGTAYWIVVVRTVAASGGNVYVQSAASGTAMVAYSANGSSWTPVNSYTVNYRIHWQGEPTFEITSSHYYGFHATSETEYGGLFESTYDAGARGVSVVAEGLQGNSTWGNGVQGNSVNNAAVRGISTNDAGGSFSSSASWGVIGAGVNAVWGQAASTGTGVYGTSSSGDGISGVSTSGNAVYGSTTTGNGLYIYKTNGTANALSTIARIEMGTSGTAAAGFGSMIDFWNENAAGSSGKYAGIGALTQNASATAGGGGLVFYTSSQTGGFTEKMKIDSAGVVTVNGQLTTDNSFGELWDNVGTTIATIAGAYRTITSLQAGDYNEVTLGDSSMTITQAGTYLVTISASFTHATNNTIVHVSLFEDGVHDDSIEIERKIGTGGDYGAGTASGLVSVGANAVMKVRAISDNAGNTTFSHINFSMTRIK